MIGEPCPCGSSAAYAGCCGPLHDGAAADTAESLMRARYSAYALRHEDYVFRTWHPRTRPEVVSLPESLTWTGLQVIAITDGGPDDASGTVEFVAHCRDDSGSQRLHETSRFERRAGRWVYVDGDVATRAPR